MPAPQTIGVHVIILDRPRTQKVGQRVGQTRYFDAAGFPGRTVGLEERKAASR